MNKIISICIMILGIISLFNCEKEESNPSIRISNLNIYKNYYVRDTIKINYIVNSKEFDSISLYVNDSIYKTQTNPENVFYFIPDSSGQYSLKLKIFYNSNEINESKTIFLQVLNLKNPALKIDCTRIDGDKNYFVGEKLNIIVVPEWDWMNLGFIKKVTLFLNNENLGTKYLPPYSYETSIITNSENTVKLEIIDTANHIFLIDIPLHVPVNTPPNIEFGFRHQNNILSGYFYSINPIIFSINGSDNVVTRYVDYYLDDKYIATDSINKDYFAYRELIVDTIKPGRHSSYCVAFDDRGDSTISDVKDFVIYKTIDIDDKIIDIENTENKSIIYAVSKSKLYIINPEIEEITNIINLPFQDPTSIDFVSEENKLYIGFSDGHLIYFDEATSDFTTILKSEITNIEDIKIDHEFHIAILISDKNILLLNLLSNNLTFGPISVYNGSKLIMDQINKTIITGGNPGISRSNLYKLYYTSNSISLIDQKGFLLYIDKLLLKPGSSIFTIKENSGIYCTSYKTFDYNNFIEKGQYRSNQPQSACYSTDGNRFFIGNDLEKYIKVYNTNNFSLMNSIYIPLTDYNNVEHIITNTDNSKLVLATRNVFYDEVKIIFVRL